MQFVETFREKTQHHLARIEVSLKKELDRYSEYSLCEPIMYALKNGKKIRPLILLLSTEAIGGANEDPLPVAVVMELLHTESIIHDDIIDEDTSRRDRESFHVKYGHNASVLTADFVFGMILDIASRYRDPRILQEISSAALRMCEGEFRELKIYPSACTMNWDEYVSLLSHKTASLFEASAKVGGILGAGQHAEIRGLAKYGLNIGIAYQIQDDILDIGDDQKIITSLELNMSTEEIKPYLKKKAEYFSEEAKKALSVIKDNNARKLLMDLSDFTVLRPF